MKKIISFIFIIFLISCSDIVSDYQEQEEILDYEEYLYQGWNAFEAVNLDEISQDSSSAYYYNFALDMFNVSLLAIDFEFDSQGLVGPVSKSYNGIGWSQLYYASEFLEPSMHQTRDSLRQQSKISFDSAYVNLNNDSQLLTTKDRCDTYAGLAYINYYLGLDDLDFQSSLDASDSLLVLDDRYDFIHDEFTIENIHYLRGKIYLSQDLLADACEELMDIPSIACECDVNLDINIILDCFNQFVIGD
tara:strand:- start:643 stop:1383 length:741 start_codon:yes stop_codon:yes gene_type:complete